MHPFISEAMVAARQRDIEASLAHRHWSHAERRARGRTRRPPRVALGMSLIGLGLRLVDVGAQVPPTISPSGC